MTPPLSRLLCACFAVGMLLSFSGCADFFTRPDESGPTFGPPPDPIPPSPPDPPHPHPQ